MKLLSAELRQDDDPYSQLVYDRWSDRHTTFTLDLSMVLTAEEAQRVWAYFRGEDLDIPGPKALPGVIEAEFVDD